MGKDKYENEELLKYGFPVKFLFKEDLWFHVKDYSSAHVYLRL
jgi:predicted ribosome quality control (RQC) complex YloA/Tae2 family protein